MKYLDEFRDKRLIRKAADKINALKFPGRLKIMEVCGTHTQNFLKFGLRQFLPANLEFIAGPGCPVCVSDQAFVDRALACADNKDTVVLTFGDMLRVPGSSSTLEQKRAEQGNVRIAYSPLDAVFFARANPQTRVVFLAVGFETTAPGIALSVMLAKKQRLKNLFFLSSLKLMPPAMAYLVKDRRLDIDGFLCPGHVSAIIGSRPYAFIPRRYGLGCCISGFEPLDILEGIYMLVRQITDGKPRVANEYARVVKPEGNLRARKIIYRVFKAQDASWRGLGTIPDSGLRLKGEYAQFDAQEEFPVSAKRLAMIRKPTKCRCGDVLKGLINPETCVLFAKSCKPEHPVGPCMVSSEGACNAYYKYR